VDLDLRLSAAAPARTGLWLRWTAATALGSAAARVRRGARPGARHVVRRRAVARAPAAAPRLLRGAPGADA